ncbi:BQ2448_2023 [Microbotryum intermedium]|uniref:BQ2448_2023 protein n=1 Tax=Microbotryum intermedium TaxID=269621 RepID=A0A238FAG1_9BASI|nr:BQ2448_2023 [Microbotryum intermedium]
MSGFSSPGSLLTVNASSTPIQVLSVAKVAAGLAAFIAPAFFTTRAFGFSASKGPNGVSVGGSVGSNTTNPGNESELSVAVRLFGARDIALGLLLRDSTSAVVVRALQVGVIADSLDILAAGLGWIEGNLSPEVATAVGSIGAVLSAYQLWILNRV